MKCAYSPLAVPLNSSLTLRWSYFLSLLFTALVYLGLQVPWHIRFQDYHSFLIGVKLIWKALAFYIYIKKIPLDLQGKPIRPADNVTKLIISMKNSCMDDVELSGFPHIPGRIFFVE